MNSSRQSRRGGAESRRQVGDRLLGEVAREAIQRRVPEPPDQAGLRVSRAAPTTRFVRVEV